jgi:hypothetical protein
LKLTAELKRWTVKTVREYANKMNVKPPFIVLEMFHNSNLEKWEHMGMYYGDEADILFINVAQHENKLHLRHTIVHELVHKKHMRLKHGEKFNKRVQEILGKRIPIL